MSTIASSQSNVYVISGASKGIGFEFSKQLLSKTAGKVIALSKSTLVALQSQYPGRLQWIPVNLAD